MTRFFFTLVLIGLVTLAAYSQTTEFTFQGSLKDGAAPANANYDFEFALFDALSAGSQIGATIPKSNVPVANGIFSVKLDFGPAFPGANRFLEIHIRQTGGGAFTTLAPRQMVNSAPYSVKSLSAANADTVNAGNITGVLGASQGGTGIGPNPPFAGTFLRSDGTGWVADGIHNNDLPSGSGNYIQNRTSQQAFTNFHISGDGIADGNLTADTVRANTQFNIGGSRVLSTVGSNNVFVGPGTGSSNNTGTGNSFLGQDAGNVNTSGSFNTFVGRWAGFSNTNADSNTFVGFSAGKVTTGGSNSFFGNAAGNTNTTGTSNTALGAGSDVASGNLGHATAIGAGAIVSYSNDIKLGRDNGLDTVEVPGDFATGGQAVIQGNATVYGTIALGLAAAGSTPLCYNNSFRIAGCSSSLRYKADLASYGEGFDIVRRLRPISFTWKDGGMRDVGFGAEDVEKIDPRFVTYNDKGEVEGVKYDRLSVAFVNAFKEQQAQIEALQKQNEALKNALCSINSKADICPKVR